MIDKCDRAEAAGADLESALQRCAQIVRESDPGKGPEAIRAKHKQFDELWSLAIMGVRRVHGAEATRDALLKMGQRNRVHEVRKEAIPEILDDEFSF